MPRPTSPLFSVLRWFLTSVVVLTLVSMVTFVLVSISPGDPARTLAGRDATAEQYAHVKSELGLDRPIWEQYGDWASHAVRGDLGQSLLSGQAVGEQLGQRAGVTLSLIAGATALAVVVGVGLGIASARAHGLRRSALDTAALLGLAIPNFWLGLILVALLAVAVPLFPATGYQPIDQSVAGWAHALALPVLTLGVGSAAALAKQTRDCLSVELGREYVTVLRLQGVPERSVVLRHALRNAALPITTVAGLLVVGLLGGTVLVESVFVLPGLGGLAVQATLDSDLPVIQGVVVVFTTCVLLVNLLVELIHRWAVPMVTR